MNMNAVLAWTALGVIGLVGLVLFFYLAIGLFQARSLLRRELGAYFLSPIAYVVLVVFLLVTGYLFYLTLNLLTETGPRGAEFPMQVILGDGYFWLVFVFIAPLLTMRVFAEERSTGTLEVLMTSPLHDWQVVLSKYLACLGFYVLLWTPTLVYLPILVDAKAPITNFETAWTPWSITMVTGLGLILVSLFLLIFRVGTALRIVTLVLFLVGAIATGVGGWMHYNFDSEHLLEIPVGIDPMPVLTSYLGLFLAGAMFLALGMFVSSMVRSQMVAALISLVLSLLFVVGGFWRPEMDTSTLLYQLFTFLSVPVHFARDFSRGVIDTRALVLYGSVAAFFLFLTVRSLESRRWS